RPSHRRLRSIRWTAIAHAAWSRGTTRSTQRAASPHAGHDAVRYAPCVRTIPLEPVGEHRVFEPRAHDEQRSNQRRRHEREPRSEQQRHAEYHRDGGGVHRMPYEAIRPILDDTLAAIGLQPRIRREEVVDRHAPSDAEDG